nr:integrase, catalytic region, zinc finger, CCHC-type, peptidase aspartic, catalytic [Tanacetum cinerariifolium]
KFLGTVKFRNDHVAKIMGYGDYQIGNVTISRVYYMEGLGHNLFSVGQLCDSDLEVAFRQHTCFIRNLDGVDLLTGYRGNNLYTLSLQDMMASSPICLLTKASKTKSWLWHPFKETLSKLRGKAVVNETVPLHSIDPELLKIDVAPLALKLCNNRTTLTDYIRHTQEETATLREIVKSERLLNPLNTSLDNACTKLMAVTPKNNDKKIRLTKHIPSSGNTTIKTTSSTNIASNTPDSTRTKKVKKNKLEDHHRTVRPGLNKKKSVVDTKSISYVTNSKSNVNADLKCATLPLREPIPIVSNTDTPVVTLVYSRKSKAAKKKVPVSNLKITKSLVANKTEPKNSWGSASSNVPSLLIECRLSKLFYESVNEKKYILVIIDDYSRFTWVKFLRSNDEAPDFIIKFLKMIQVRLKVLVRRIQTDNGTEFVNQTLREYYEEVGISHETSVARSPQQN